MNCAGNPQPSHPALLSGGQSLPPALHVVSGKGALGMPTPRTPPFVYLGICVVPKLALRSCMARMDFKSPLTARSCPLRPTRTSRPRRGAHAPSPVEPAARARHHITHANSHLCSFRSHCGGVVKPTPTQGDTLGYVCMHASWAHGC